MLQATIAFYIVLATQHTATGIFIIYLAKIYFIDLDNNIQEIQLFKYWREEKGKSESKLESFQQKRIDSIIEIAKAEHMSLLNDIDFLIQNSNRFSLENLMKKLFKAAVAIDSIYGAQHDNYITSCGSYNRILKWQDELSKQDELLPDGLLFVAFDNEQKGQKNYLDRGFNMVTYYIVTSFVAFNMSPENKIQHTNLPWACDSLDRSQFDELFNISAQMQEAIDLKRYAICQGYCTKNQLSYFKKCADHHKFWDFICSIYHQAMAMELLWPYVKSHSTPSVEEYLAWVKEQQDSLYLIKYEQKAARRVFSPVWSARCHPIYRLIEAANEVQLMKLHPEIRQGFAPNQLCLDGEYELNEDLINFIPLAKQARQSFIIDTFINKGILLLFRLIPVTKQEAEAQKNEENMTIPEIVVNIETLLKPFGEKVKGLLDTDNDPDDSKNSEVGDGLSAYGKIKKIGITCSAGFWARSQPNINFIATAGHCYNPDFGPFYLRPWNSTPTPTYKIEEMHFYYLESIDFGLINIDNKDIQPVPSLNGFTSDGEYFRDNIFVANLRYIPGDSGGPVFYYKNLTHVSLNGIVTGGLFDFTDNINGITGVITISSILNAFEDLEVVTTS
ncbi:hypothetical protein C2G38_2206781 [Gigaspora rosea]|uniref:Peptidase S1 domain-containing protein n=1 Tax=Gigaspora rosea TaxID=44941 RepID=A0A397USN6_9GLOM|nr:hypothetical protein C2G38_2206781 [Gigaspora rosea]